jgi:hypothetical protein
MVEQVKQHAMEPCFGTLRWNLAMEPFSGSSVVQDVVTVIQSKANNATTKNSCTPSFVHPSF